MHKNCDFDCEFDILQERNFLDLTNSVSRIGKLMKIIKKSISRPENPLTMHPSRKSGKKSQELINPSNCPFPHRQLLILSRTSHLFIHQLSSSHNPSVPLGIERGRQQQQQQLVEDFEVRRVKKQRANSVYGACTLRVLRPLHSWSADFDRATPGKGVFWPRRR